MRKYILAGILFLLIPYIGTLAWTGRAGRAGEMASGASGYQVILDRGGSEQTVDLEEYVIGAAAVQLPPECGPEVMKAQTMIARTYIRLQMGEETSVRESALQMEYYGQGQMKEAWGQDAYLERYRMLREAAAQTRGMVLTWNDSLIEPLFHAISAGATRQGDALHPYLTSVEEAEDVEGENYMTILSFSGEELASRLNAMEDSPQVEADRVLESIQIISRDGAGYVESVQVGQKTYTGEELRFALGLPSSAFVFETQENGIRCTVRGVGHGYGFDQCGAMRKEKQGWTAEELLAHYYKDVTIQDGGSLSSKNIIRTTE